MLEKSLLTSQDMSIKNSGFFETYLAVLGITEVKADTLHDPAPPSFAIDGGALVTIIIAVLGASFWVVNQMAALKDSIAALKGSIDLTNERLNDKTSRLVRVEAELKLIEKAIYQQINLLDDKNGVVFNALISLYREVATESSRIDDIQSFLENATVDYDCNADGVCSRRSYRRSNATANQEKLEEIRRLIISYTVKNQAGPISSVLES